MNQPGRSLPTRILAELSGGRPRRAADLATALGVDRRDITRCLTSDLAGQVQQGPDYAWRLLDANQGRDAGASAQPGTEIARLCRYYLECIGQDMDDGVSAFAKGRGGPPDYAELRGLPMVGGPSGWFNEPGVGAVLAKVQADRTKLQAWLGYPVRLRHHRTPTWEGHFVEPLLLWRIELADRDSTSPRVSDDAPVFNGKFLRAVAMGDAFQLAEESARLNEELGLNQPLADLPDIDELLDRLVRIRPDWDWQDELDPRACPAQPGLAALQQQGIYNRAIVLAGERSPYTQGLESELKSLGDVMQPALAQTALGRWLEGNVAADAATTTDDGEPLIEVLPMNTEQRAAVRSALQAPHTVVTGPPGTGKSQVVTNILMNAAWRGMKVLFASKNNKAVDVVEGRVNGLANRPVLLRLGSREYQGQLANHLTKLLSGNPTAEDQANYDDSLARHRDLAARLAELDQAQQQTLDARNQAERLDAEAEDARGLLGECARSLTAALVDQAERDLTALAVLVRRVGRDQQALIVRLAWPLVRSARLKDLARGMAAASASSAALGMPPPVAAAGQPVPDLAGWMDDCALRLGAARKLLAFRQAAAVLERSCPFEDIAQQRAGLADQIARNSERLWRDWVQLAPKRLTPQQRKDVADYVAVLNLTTGPDAQQLNRAVWQQARALQAKVTEQFACWAVTSLSARGRVPMQPGYFDLVVIDEASQCDIASALPLLFRAKRSVIIGDPQQLRHISALSRPRDSELQHKHGLVQNRIGWMYSVSSLFDVAAGVVPQAGIVNLRDHHRSHADIIEFSNRAFYEGRLRVATRYQGLRRPGAEQAGVVWRDVQGRVVRPPSGGAQNAQEAAAVVAALEDLLVRRGFQGTVGVVTPFRAQAQLLKERVAASSIPAAVQEQCELLVDTVHRFQGDERDVMVFSPVVSDGTPAGALGFLRGNGNLFNVAITRARGLLLVVGDQAAARASGVDYLSEFASYVASLGAASNAGHAHVRPSPGADYPSVARPEQVSDWERVLYRALYAAGIQSIPQYTVERYDLDLAVIVGDRKLDIEVDGERHHRTWTGERCLRDQLRNQRLIELGWEVRRFWVHQVRDELEVCVARVMEWVERAAARASVSAGERLGPSG